MKHTTIKGFYSTGFGFQIYLRNRAAGCWSTLKSARAHAPRRAVIEKFEEFAAHACWWRTVRISRGVVK